MFTDSTVDTLESIDVFVASVPANVSKESIEDPAAEAVNSRESTEFCKAVKLLPVATPANTVSIESTDADNAVSAHEADTTSVHGIADTSLLATKAYADNAASVAVAAESSKVTWTAEVECYAQPSESISSAVAAIGSKTSI